MENWNYWEKIYQLHSQTRSFKQKVLEAIQIIEDFPKVSGLSLDQFYSTCSAGKDSTVLSVLCNRAFPGIKIFSEKDNFDFPEEIPYLENIAAKENWNLEIVNVAINPNQIQNDICDEIHSRGIEFSDQFFYNVIAKFKKKYGYQGVYLGLRRQESKQRRINLYQKSPIYQKKDGEWICNPLHNWNGKDIFGFLIKEKLPILSVYKKLKFISTPEKIRKSWYLPGARACEGQVQWLKYYYPELFNQLVEWFPLIRSYL